MIFDPIYIAIWRRRSFAEAVIYRQTEFGAKVLRRGLTYMFLGRTSLVISLQALLNLCHCSHDLSNALLDWLPNALVRVTRQ